MTVCFAVSCQYDDSEIWDKLNDHESRIAYLEKICDEMNTDISNLKTIVTALETNDYIINAYPLATNDGYTLVFKSGKSIVVHNGKDGVDGTNGKDGVVPKISVKQDTDGLYYWTIDGEWLLIDGEKVRASAIDGKNGEDGKDGVDGVDGEDGNNGKDGITPQFKIEENYWYISYDNGLSWVLLGKATGSNGLDGINGADGDSMFKRVYVEDGYVCFELNDDINTIIRIPLMKDGILQVVLEEEGTLSRILTSEQTRTTTVLSIKGCINADDMRHIQIMSNLQKLDLSNVTGIGYDNYAPFELNPYQDTIINKSLEEIILPKFEDTHTVDFSYCLALNKVTITSDVALGPNNFCPNVTILEYAEGIKHCKNWGGWNTMNSIEEIIYPSTMQYIPYTITICPDCVRAGKNYGYNYVFIYTIPCKKVICKSLTPPIYKDETAYASFGYDYINDGYYFITSDGTKHFDKVIVPNGTVLYVPKESIELYKAAPLWEIFTDIRAIEDME